MNNKIDKFEGEYRWLSNFWASEVELDGFLYPTVEHAYQAAKTYDSVNRAIIREATSPGKAKKLGKSINLREDWNEVKLEIMEDLLRQKFIYPSSLASKLIMTYPDELVEGNWWGDVYWGICNGVGENHLGKLLMKIRQELVAKFTSMEY